MTTPTQRAVAAAASAERPPFPARALASADARLLNLPHLPTRLLLESEGQGRFSLVEHTVEPRCLGAWLHKHTREDEFSFVLEGELTAKLGDEVMSAGPGTLVFKPRNQVHTFWNASDEPVRFLEILSPAGFEGLFVEISSLPAPTGPDPMGELRQRAGEIAARYGLEFYFEQTQELLKEHGLRYV